MYISVFLGAVILLIIMVSFVTALIAMYSLRTELKVLRQENLALGVLISEYQTGKTSFDPFKGEHPERTYVDSNKALA
jgi:ABC-type maltose transport system permease subunit